MRLSEAFSSRCNVYRSDTRLVGFGEGAGLISAFGAVIVLLIRGQWQGVGVRRPT